MRNHVNPHEAIEQLEAMQRQIVHGKRTFGDIADCIRSLCSIAEAARVLVQSADDRDNDYVGLDDLRSALMSFPQPG